METAHPFEKVIQIKQAVDAPEEGIGRNMCLEIELVELMSMNPLPSKQRKPCRSP